MFYFVSSNTNASVGEELWDECDDSIFSGICDQDLTEKVTVHEPTQTNGDAESTKRKYCATEESNNRLCQQTFTEQKKLMVKKLKINSLFKF